MSELGKVITTLGIWAALTVILVMNSINNDGSTIWMTLILGLAAAASTGFIWGGRVADHAPTHEQEQTVRRKRGSRTRRLIEKLDEDEIVDLEDLLAARREDRLIDEGTRR